MSVKSVQALVEMCENQLGFDYDLENGIPIYKQRRIEVGKIKRKMKENPKLFTLENLELALEYSWRKRLAIKSPMGLFWRIEAALEDAVEKDNRTDVQMSVDDAVAWELGHQDDETETWVGRLLRAQGHGAQEALEIWKKAGRGG